MPAPTCRRSHLSSLLRQGTRVPVEIVLRKLGAGMAAEAMSVTTRD